MLNIIPIRAFQDNYIWVIRNAGFAAVVDPGDAAPVLDYLSRERLQLAAILNTHHHPDHVGGNAELLAHSPVPVFGPCRENIATVTHPLSEGDVVELPELAARFAVLDVPGHTAGHIAYYGANSLFCGDTLFGCGCGRLFEGSAAQLYTSLQKLAKLPGDTAVYCAHEYTLANIAFAKAVDPHNRELLQREARDAATRTRGLPTLPSTLALEMATNPFLRCGDPAVMETASAVSGGVLSDPAQVFAVLREWKNRF
jgi:hydroxyacylglutathione hydrolase